MTLRDYIEKELEDNDDFLYVVEDFVEYYEKWTAASKTSTEFLAEGNKKTFEAIDEVTMKYLKLYQKSKEEFISFLPDIPQFESINGHTQDNLEFYEWLVERKPGGMFWMDLIKVKYKPKDVSVSFWKCRPKNIILK